MVSQNGQNLIEPIDAKIFSMMPSTNQEEITGPVWPTKVWLK